MKVEVQLTEIQQLQKEEYDKGFKAAIEKVEELMKERERRAYSEGFNEGIANIDFEVEKAKERSFKEGFEEGKKSQKELYEMEKRELRNHFEQTINTIGDMAVTFCERLD